MTTQTNEQRITALAQTIGADIKDILASIGDLSALTTTQKASLVLAMNELKAAIGNIDVSSVIDDTATASIDKTWSVTKISNAISAAVAALVNSAPEAMDTLKELSDAISTNQGAIEALETLAGKHVRYDEAQTLTDAQQSQARSNIGAAASADVGTLSSLNTTEKGSLVGAVNEVNTAAGNAATAAAKADGKAVAAQNDVDALETALGTIDTNYAAIYTAARNGTSS